MHKLFSSRVLTSSTPFSIEGTPVNYASGWHEHGQLIGRHSIASLAQGPQEHAIIADPSATLHQRGVRHSGHQCPVICSSAQGDCCRLWSPG